MFGAAWFGPAWFGPAWFGVEAAPHLQDGPAAHGGGRKDERLRELIAQIIRRVTRRLSAAEREALLVEFAQQVTFWEPFYSLLFDHELNARIQQIEEEELIALLVALDDCHDSR